MRSAVVQRSLSGNRPPLNVSRHGPRSVTVRDRTCYGPCIRAIKVETSASLGTDVCISKPTLSDS